MKPVVSTAERDTAAAEMDLRREWLRVQAAHVARLVDMAAKAAQAGGDTRLAEERLELVEGLLWRQHARLIQVQKAFADLIPDNDAG